MRDAGNSTHAHHQAQPAPAAVSHTPAAPSPAKTARHHGRHEGHRVEDFRRRFWISLALTVPILALTPPWSS